MRIELLHALALLGGEDRGDLLAHLAVDGLHLGRALLEDRLELGAMALDERRPLPGQGTLDELGGRWALGHGHPITQAKR